MTFVCLNSDAIAWWQPQPDDGAAHLALLAFMRDRLEIVFLQPPPNLTIRRQGNLGELFAYFIGRVCEGFDGHSLAANAEDPLSDISVRGIDCVWFTLG